MNQAKQHHRFMLEAIKLSAKGIDNGEPSESCQGYFTYHPAARDLVKCRLQRINPKLPAIPSQNRTDNAIIHALRQALQINTLP